MRLWHYKLIPLLPRQQLLGQHRECCALRGNGWGKKHATVDYVFKYNLSHLFSYHQQVMCEMNKRGYNIADEWKDISYRGKCCEKYQGELIEYFQYPEHNDEYLNECILNLKNKNIVLTF